MVRLDPAILHRVGMPMHVHTDYSPTSDPDHCAGQQTPSQVCLLAEDLGFEAVGTAEHSGIPATGRLERIPDNPDHPLYSSLLQRMIAEAESHLESGIEANIMPDGSLDVPASLIRQLDEIGGIIVTASQHGLAKVIEKEPAAIKARLSAAANNPDVDILGHPTRYNDDVPGVDWPTILAEASRSGTVIELNFNQWLKWTRERRKKTSEDRQKWTDQGHRNALAWYRSWQTWLPMVADSGVAVSYGLDIHNRGMWPDGTESWSPTAFDLLEFFEQVEGAGIESDRVVNSSLRSFVDWHFTPKPERPALLA